MMVRMRLLSVAYLRPVRSAIGFLRDDESFSSAYTHAKWKLGVWNVPRPMADKTGCAGAAYGRT
jgi:hypothetical protein